MRARHVVVFTLAGLIALSGCAPPPRPDPDLVALVEEAQASARSAQLGLELDERGRIFPTTARALFDDMSQDLADSVRELELHPSGAPQDAQYRVQALALARAALEGIRTAQGGDISGGLDAVTAAADGLARLGESR